MTEISDPYRHFRFLCLESLSSRPSDFLYNSDIFQSFWYRYNGIFLLTEIGASHHRQMRQMIMAAIRDLDSKYFLQYYNKIFECNLGFSRYLESQHQFASFFHALRTCAINIRQFVS